jgi:hypothetical protein
MPTKPKEKPMIKRVKTSLSLPEDLWKSARIRALQEGVDAQDLVARALEAYLRKGGPR